MFENIAHFFKRFRKSEKEESKSTAKERLHLVLAQDRANISADFLEMMKQEILEVIKKYIDIDEKAIDVRLTNKEGEDGSLGAPALYANIPIITIKNEARKLEGSLNKNDNKSEPIKANNVDIKEKDQQVGETKTEKAEIEETEVISDESTRNELNENVAAKEVVLDSISINNASTVNSEVTNSIVTNEAGGVAENQQNELNNNLNEVDNEEKNS